MSGPTYIFVTIFVSGLESGNSTYLVSPVVVPKGISVVVWNLVTQWSANDIRATFLQDKGINPDRSVEGLVVDDQFAWNPAGQTQWVVWFDNQVPKSVVSSYKINSGDSPGPDDPTIIFTTDPVIPPP